MSFFTQGTASGSFCQMSHDFYTQGVVNKVSMKHILMNPTRKFGILVLQLNVAMCSKYVTE